MLKMADDVEAELEAPEALEIARGDILLSKMEEERERCARNGTACRCCCLSAAAAAAILPLALLAVLRR